MLYAAISLSLQSSKSFLDNSILHCEELRPFWVMWEEDGVKFGKGYELGGEQLLFLEETSPIPVNAISLGGEHRLIKWEFFRSMGRYTSNTTGKFSASVCHEFNA